MAGPFYFPAPVNYPGRGVGNQVFNSGQTLPLYNATGRGYFAGTFRTLQPPQEYYFQQLTPIDSAGYGGLLTGQVFSQPLVTKGSFG